MSHYQSVSRSVSHSISQLTSPSINQSINQSINKAGPVDHLMYPSFVSTTRVNGAGAVQGAQKEGAFDGAVLD